MHQHNYRGCIALTTALSVLLIQKLQPQSRQDFHPEIPTGMMGPVIITETDHIEAVAARHHTGPPLVIVDIECFPRKEDLKSFVLDEVILHHPIALEFVLYPQDAMTAGYIECCEKILTTRTAHLFPVVRQDICHKCIKKAPIPMAKPPPHIEKGVLFEKNFKVCCYKRN